MGLSDIKNAMKKLQVSSKEPSKPADDLFANPIAVAEPAKIFARAKHQQPPQGCKQSECDAPIHTNNFYNNLTLEDQTFPVWTQPYSLWLTKDPDQDAGFAFNHTEASQRVFGPDPGSQPAQYYFNPPRIKSFVVGGEGFDTTNIRLSLENHSKMAVTAVLKRGSDSGSIQFPLAYGMGFVTAIYNGIKPIIASQVGVHHFDKKGSVGSVDKYRVELFNQVVWTMYVSGQKPEFCLKDGRIVGNSCGQFVVQICRGESSHYDESAGTYATSCTLSGKVSSKDGRSCKYNFKYGIGGNSKSNKLVIWCLPHHQEALTKDTRNTDTNMRLDSTTKGIMRAYLTNDLAMEETNLPTQINWEPWSEVSSFKGEAKYSKSALDAIRNAAEKEVDQDVIGMADIDSMYTSGKILDKFAYILYVCHFVLKDDKLTKKLFPQITKAIEIFSSNKQKFPLLYDTSWKGLISSADPGADFGNANYNDHHFHYGYHIHAVALVAYVDKSFNGGKWFSCSNVKNYTDTLIRDVANPSTQDPFFPQFRSFDWFHGHSFAHGIFASGDGKDEESSSEDYHCYYGMKLFAKITGDAAMESRANLILSIMRRSMNMYMLYSDDNQIQPPNFIGNKVAGISFENKIDFATYFGRGTIGNEWIHGIHMLPITPMSSYIRGEKFVREEWQQILQPIVERIPDGWKGILMLNLALCDPKSAWKWFSGDDWNDALIDNGMSRTWSLAYIAAVGGI
ncbi:glycoside hydrolase [Yamadazyma tenuis ATCC 10573]|uniref:glucan endo-1,3-beta-D-glucosidase n=1 Tax=Candida tenuis (strain ATCC 10573 / BCRC 21748 / CBS 615 / JCM 9827 / NBRC 10315 / NRRL Y-1498 / VKM Y-70) TaxID=590646 RepID=G3BEM4_CANTC|nr:glycoside hydrolase [Yamadazyma tenuis ATCC 10573]EGV59927.1 glycoside hydrolase [Yamadazyma tenuis ATCC 10573]